MVANCLNSYNFDQSNLKLGWSSYQHSVVNWIILAQDTDSWRCGSQRQLEQFDDLARHVRGKRGSKTLGRGSGLNRSLILLMVAHACGYLRFHPWSLWSLRRQRHLASEKRSWTAGPSSVSFRLHRPSLIHRDNFWRMAGSTYARAATHGGWAMSHHRWRSQFASLHVTPPSAVAPPATSDTWPAIFLCCIIDLLKNFHDFTLLKYSHQYWRDS